MDKQLSQTTISHSLRKNLLFWFLLLGLLPLLLASLFAYQTIRSTSTEATYSNLEAALDGKKRHLYDLFSSLDQTMLLVTDTLKLYQQDSAEMKKWLGILAKQYGYGDILLVDRTGRVFFSIAQRSDLFTDLNLSDSASGVRDLFNLVSKSRQINLVDLAPYGPAGGDPKAFIGAPVENGNELEMVVIIELPMGHVNAIMQSREGLGKTGETFLVGQDKRMRSDALLDPEARSVRASFFGTIEFNGVDSPATRDALAGNSGRHSGVDYRGLDILGVYQPIKISGITWAIIVQKDQREALAESRELGNILIGVVLSSIVVILMLALKLANGIANPVITLSKAASLVEKGDLSARCEATSTSEIGVLITVFNKMVDKLQQSALDIKQKDYITTGRAELADVMRGEKKLDILSQDIVGYLVGYTGSQLGALFISDHGQNLSFSGGYAYQASKEDLNFKLGEGLIGQTAKDQQMLLIKDVREEFFAIALSEGEMKPKNILLYPFIYGGRVVAVLELASFDDYQQSHIDFLQSVAESIAIGLHTIKL